MSKFSDIYGETSEGLEKETDEQLYEKTKKDMDEEISKYSSPIQIEQYFADMDKEAIKRLNEMLETAAKIMHPSTEKESDKKEKKPYVDDKTTSKKDEIKA